MKILIVGGDSKVGKALYAHLVSIKSSIDISNHTVSTTTRGAVVQKHQRHLDLLNPMLPADEDFDLIYLVAAVTGIMACEADAQNSWRVNADGPAQLALQASRKNIRVGPTYAADKFVHTVFISSDAVESGPKLNYSMQKAYVEGIVLSLGGSVVRPAWIGPEMDSVVKLLVEVGTKRKPGLHRWSG